MKLFAVVLLSGLAVASLGQNEGAGKVAQCECAVFQDDKPATDAKPLLVQTPSMILNCSDPKTKEDCKNMCVTLASASKDQVPQVICEAMKIHVDHLKQAVFYKVCDMAKWEYSGRIANHTICCHEGSPRTCGGGTTAALEISPLKETLVSSTAPPTTNDTKA